MLSFQNFHPIFLTPFIFLDKTWLVKKIELLLGSGIDTSVSSQNPNGCAYIDRILDLKMVSFNTYGRCLTLYSELDCKGEQRIFKGIYPDLAKKGWANKARSIAPLPDNLVCLG